MVTRRTFALLFLSVTFAVAAAWVANNWIANQQGTQTAAVPAEEKVPAVVAALDVPYGQTIEARHVKIVQLPESAAPPNSFTSLDQVVGKVATQPLLADEVIRIERISDGTEGATFAALIDPKKRAFTVRVNDVVGVAGFLLPGNKVDVIGTRKNSGSDRVISETVLREIKVLAVDQMAKANSTDPVVVRAVTLEVSPKEAEKLAKARDEGSIQLTLLNPVPEQIAVVEPKKTKPAGRSYSQPRVIVIKGTEWQRKKVPM
ncbi:Flp pilus assembly protein CpaB [Marinobacterium arenosum]|uniref:Flp pilus assembly protein CpaB n=1 Tax=Marinobacterium arenosum TaxID=2862496 RepID=UPI001C93F4DC|nr:Flp pilus assembly protein CpaB [Marinobacterium arenosum]MBY4675733.1 Flp pilus assembly protein CpaB [Marinobacterium arenosum]